MHPNATYLDRVREIVTLRLRGHPVEVYLFGSWARGEARRLSDIDVGILPRGDLPIALLSRIQEELEESSVPYPVELVNLREVSPDFLARVRKEGVRWNV